MSDPTLVEVLGKTERWFRTKGLPSPRLEAETLLGHVLGLQRLQLYLQHDRPLVPIELEKLRGLVARRGRREPLAWILGSVGFHDIDLAMAPDVLVPRPDTETLVEAALSWMEPTTDPLYVADLGCGSGAIGLALARQRPNLRVYAVDLSEAALALTKRNVEALGLSSRVAVLRGDWLAAIPATRPVDWVLSNPPYIRSDQLPELQPEVSRWEPKLALDGGLDGLDAYRRLIPAVSSRVKLGVLFEVGAGQAGQVSDLLRQAGWTSLNTWPDLAGVPRVVGARR